MKKTLTEALMEEVVMNCYLCGKGKITMTTSDIVMTTPHPIDQKVRAELQSYLLKQAKEFLNKLTPQHDE